MSNLYENLTFRSSIEENKPVNYLCSRQDIHRSIKFLEAKIINNCGYCRRCCNCITFHTHHNELNKKGFYTFQKDVVYWDVQNPEFNIKNFVYEIKPVFKIED